MAQDIASFTIVHRDEFGKPDYIYPWNGRLAACVAASINLCRGMLRYHKPRSAMYSFTRDFNRDQPNAWYSQHDYGYEELEEAVVAFTKTILAVFPIVYVDDSIKNPGCLGGHCRREWSVYDFQPRDQPILLNASRVRDMVAAATIAENSNDPNDYHHQQFRSFIWLFANTLFHEMGHLLLTFLSGGQATTPPRMDAQFSGYSVYGRGEAGRNLETILQNGTLELWRDHSRDDSQTGIPYIVTQHGARRISQQSIDATVSYQFHFPYHLEGPWIDPNSMEHLGRHLPQDVLTDPMVWILGDEIRRHCHPIYVGPNSSIARLPFHPGFRAQGA